MSDSIVLLALFKDVNSVPNILDELRQSGIGEHDMSVLSGMPYPARILGRPMVWERLPVIALTGAVVGFLIGIFLTAGTPLLYPVHVGGQPLIPIPSSVVIVYEFTMTGLIVSTFLGVLWESSFPTFGPKYYHPRLTDGYLGVVFRCPTQKADNIRTMLTTAGAVEIVEPEEKLL